jgi:hypothetical protein
MGNVLNNPAIRKILLQSLEELSEQSREHARQAEFHLRAGKEIDHKIDALRVLLDADEQPQTDIVFPDAHRIRAQSEDGPTWSDFVFEQLRAHGPMTHKGIIAFIEGSPLEERFAKSPNAFYARVNKLQSTGRLVRVGKLLCLPDQVAKLAEVDAFALKAAGGRPLM